MRNIYTLLIFSFSFFSVFSQGNEFVNDGGEVYIENGAQLYVHGEVRLNTGSLMDNNGYIQMDGSSYIGYPSGNPNGVHWVSNGATQSGNGQVKFYRQNNTGSDSFSISGNSSVFYDLELDISDNLVSNVNYNNVLLYDDVEITNNLNFTKGKFITDANEVFVNNTNPTSTITGTFGNNYSNYVVGNLKRAVVAGNTYEYPIGSETFATGNTGYNPVVVDVATTPDASNTIVASFNPLSDIGNISFLDGGSNGTYDCSGVGGSPNQQFDLNSMVTDFGYWNLTADNSTGWDYDLDAYPSPELFVSNSSALMMKMIKAPGGSAAPGFAWGSHVLSSGDMCSAVNVVGSTMYDFVLGSYPGSPIDHIFATSLNSFSDFGIAKSGGVALPIELVTLRANPVNNEFIRVDWITATEVNNAGFEVQRSTDGVNFKEIGWVDGSGNSVDEVEYAFDDYDVEPNKTYYYRLKQIDYDGASELTYIVNAMITKEGVLTIGDFIPNPTNGNSYINVSSSDIHKIRVKIFTTLGQVINVKDFEINPGMNKMDFDFSMLADGTYHAVIMVDENEVHNKKIVITK